MSGNIGWNRFFAISLQRKSVVNALKLVPKNVVGAPKFVPKNVICLNINDICMKRKIEQLLLQWKQNPNRKFPHFFLVLGVL